MDFISGVMKSDHWLAKVIQCIIGSVALSTAMVVGGIIICYLLIFLGQCSNINTDY